jgi:hypothetical protein
MMIVENNKQWASINVSNKKKLFLAMIMGMLLLNYHTSYAQDYDTLKGKNLTLIWSKSGNTSKLSQINFTSNNKDQLVGNPSGAFTFLYSETKPGSEPAPVIKTNTGDVFPGDEYKHLQSSWNQALSPASLNTEGEAFNLFPASLEVRGNVADIVVENDHAKIRSEWNVEDYVGGSDLHIRMILTAKKNGYFSMATPAIVTTNQKDIKWATIPGYFQGGEVQNDLVLSYGYGEGIPAKPIVFRERTASTLTSILSRKDGITISATSDPGYGRNPWAYDHNTHKDWKLGLSIMNRQQDWTPTLYYPVLGEQNSCLKKGDTLVFSYHFSFTGKDWFAALKHSINTIYQFPAGLALRQNKQSLTNRLWNIEKYVTDDSTSMWRTENYHGLKIGGQAYLGGVVGSDHDAMKNSDYGAMWMLSTIMNDRVLQQTRLPYARNFKLAQQQTDTGFFQGAAIGQYYLSKSKKFTEEWGEFVEPIGLTYYIMLDIGNILLFEPHDSELLQRLKMGADLLLRWQHPNGSWEVAYDRHTHQPIFRDLEDFRPTFYGLLVAYRILKNPSYLAAAKNGADWYLKEGIDKGRSLGVCGDARYAQDFALGKTAQAYLDLYDLTKEKKYRYAAIKAAKIYVSSIYTHPVPSEKIKLVNGKKKHDWEIAQAGLSFEHGGTLGSANGAGPILLASHTGMFVRMFELTHDSVFLNMARSAAIGRDAFVDSTTSVASYYWVTMNKGAGPFPHHAWWQAGWIMDYLLSEIHLRSKGAITFPRGFITPKVGPHQSYGFAPGKVYGQPADLKLYRGLIQCDNPNMECITAIDKKQKRIHIFFLNDLRKESNGNISVNADVLNKNGSFLLSEIDDKGKKGKLIPNQFVIKMASYGLNNYVLEWK